MIRLSGIINEALGQPGQVIPNPYARAFAPMKEVETIKEQDHEVSMAQSSLDAIIKSANDLKQQLGTMEKEIPAWIQDHISKSENYIQQAANFYHEYESVEPVEEGKYNFGQKQYVNLSDSDDKLLDIALEYSKTSPNKWLKKQDTILLAWRDLTTLMGISNTPEEFKKNRFKVVKRNVIFDMYKKGNISKDDYVNLYNSLKDKILATYKMLTTSMARVSGNAAAARQARKDMSLSESLKKYKK